jgi:hypothetical protein
MKRFTTIVMLLPMFVSLTVSHAGADLVHQFKNPSFSGIGYSTHVLSLNQLQFNRTADRIKAEEAEERRLERELENSTLNKFIKNVESRIYATLSKQMVDAMFESCTDDTGLTCPTSGTTEIEDSTITWSKDTTTGEITIVVDGPDGYTEISIPGSGEFAF